MRNDQANPANSSGNADSAGCRQGSTGHHHRPCPLYGNAQTGRLPFSHGQDVNPGSGTQQQEHSHQHGRHSRRKYRRFHRGQRAHVPEYNGRQLIIGVRHILEQGQQRRKNRGYNGSAQYQHQYRDLTAQPRHAKAEPYGAKPKNKGERRRHDRAGKQQNGQRRAKARAGRNTQNPLAHQRIAE